MVQACKGETPGSHRHELKSLRPKSLRPAPVGLPAQKQNNCAPPDHCHRAAGCHGGRTLSTASTAGAAPAMSTASLAQLERQTHSLGANALLHCNDKANVTANLRNKDSPPQAKVVEGILGVWAAKTENNEKLKHAVTRNHLPLKPCLPQRRPAMPGWQSMLPVARREWLLRASRVSPQF